MSKEEMLRLLETWAYRCGCTVTHDPSHKTTCRGCHGEEYEMEWALIRDRDSRVPEHVHTYVPLEPYMMPDELLGRFFCAVRGLLTAYQVNMEAKDEGQNRL